MRENEAILDLIESEFDNDPKKALTKLEEINKLNQKELHSSYGKFGFSERRKKIKETMRENDRIKEVIEKMIAEQ